MKNLFLVLSFLSVNLFFSQKTLAWGDLGHSTIGYIADYKLTPKAKGMIYQIFGPEPLATSAVWPDGVRSDQRFLPFANYHFLEIPKGYSYATLPPEMRAAFDSDTIISQGPAILLSPNYTREQKTIILRYIIHLVGDVHQPLHIGNGVDRGANLCDVKWTDPNSDKEFTVNLHSAIDDKVIVNLAKEVNSAEENKKKTFIGYREVGDYLLKNYPDVDFATVSADPKETWYDESQALHSVIYPDVEAFQNPEDRTYCKVVDKATNKVVDGKYDKSKIPTLDEAYLQKVLPVTKKRILVAGYRLAGLLNKLAESSDAPEWTSDMDRKIFDPLMLKNQKEPEAKINWLDRLILKISSNGK